MPGNGKKSDKSHTVPVTPLRSMVMAAPTMPSKAPRASVAAAAPAHAVVGAAPAAPAAHAAPAAPAAHPGAVTPPAHGTTPHDQHAAAAHRNMQHGKKVAGPQKAMMTDSKGGKYYINAKGDKVYVDG